MNYENLFFFQIFGTTGKGLWTCKDKTYIKTRKIIEKNTISRPSATVDAKYWNSDQMLFNGSFMKIKQIQLGYSLPALVTNKLHIGHTRIYASLDDFFTFTNYPGMDPEASSSDNNSIGIDRGFFPISKKVLFGLSLNF